MLLYFMITYSPFAYYSAMFQYHSLIYKLIMFSVIINRMSATAVVTNVEISFVNHNKSTWSLLMFSNSESGHSKALWAMTAVH